MRGFPQTYEQALTGSFMQEIDHFDSSNARPATSVLNPVETFLAIAEADTSPSLRLTASTCPWSVSSLLSAITGMRTNPRLFLQAITNSADCPLSNCPFDLRLNCPPELQKKNAAGDVIGCMTDCGATVSICAVVWRAVAEQRSPARRRGKAGTDDLLARYPSKYRRNRNIAAPVHTTSPRRAPFPVNSILAR